MGDLSGKDELDCLDSDLESDLELESTRCDTMPEEGQSGLDLHELLPDIDPAHPNTAETTRGSDADLDDLEETVRNTWQ